MSLGPRALIGAFTAAMTLTLASSALAATVSTVRERAYRDGWVYVVNVDDTQGERNRLEIERSGEGVIVRDALPLRARGRRCTSLAPRTVRCEVADELEIRSGAKDDSVIVSPDDDITTYDPGPEVLAGRGDDFILLSYGGTANGEAGHDVLKSGTSGVAAEQSFMASGGAGRDRLYGGAGFDWLRGDAGSDRLRGGAGRDLLSGGTLTGGAAGRDSMFGGPGDDRFDDGDTELSGCNPVRVEPVGPDTVVGGAGSDHVSSYGRRAEPVIVDLGDPGPDGQQGEGDSLTGVEGVSGGCGADHLIGDDGANELMGSVYVADGDVMLGRGGPDLIGVTDGDDASGEAGDDELRMYTSDARLTCGEGDDRATIDVGYARPGGSTQDSGILIPPDCERLQARYFDEDLKPGQLELDPVPEVMSGDGDLVFPLFREVTGTYSFELTDSEPPFEEFDSEPLTGDQVTLTAPPHVVEAAATAPVTLRGVTLGGNVVWRFRAQQGG